MIFAENKGEEVQFRAHEKFGDRRQKVVSARTFFYESESKCDKNMWITMNCIDAVSGELLIIKENIPSYL